MLEVKGSLSSCFLFNLCVVDFVFGLVKWHSVGAGIVAIVCGLPLTSLLFPRLQDIAEGQQRFRCARQLDTRRDANWRNIQLHSSSFRKFGCKRFT